MSNSSSSSVVVPEPSAGFRSPFRSGFLAQDIFASLVVFLIAVPLSLGIAFASGAPIMAGLIAGVVGGILVGAAGGSPFQVSGPAAGLTVMVFALTQKHGWPVVCAITVGAGLVQMLFGALRIARGALAISPAVVHGMLGGIGGVIALAQLRVVLGGQPQSSPVRNLMELPAQISHLNVPSAIIGFLTIALLILWLYVPARLRSIPGGLVAVGAATLISLGLRLPVARVDLPDNLLGSFTFPRLPQGGIGEWEQIIIAVFSVALVASVESLLSAVAVDKLHTGPRSQLDRELIGQGLGNTVSGLLGGLPITGVVVRSSANVAAGAKTRLSSILHGIWILLAVAALGPFMEWIPLPALAGLLVFVGIRLVNPEDIRELAHHREAAVYFVTAFGVVAFNLLAGVGIGIALAVVLLLRRIGNAQVKVERRGDDWHVRIDGSLTFLSVPQLTATLGQIPPTASVDIDLMVDFMDHAAFDALHGWRRQQERLGGHVDIDEMHEKWYESAADGRPMRRKSGPVVITLSPGTRAAEGPHEGSENGTGSSDSDRLTPTGTL